MSFWFCIYTMERWNTCRVKGETAPDISEINWKEPLSFFFWSPLNMAKPMYADIIPHPVFYCWHLNFYKLFRSFFIFSDLVLSMSIYSSQLHSFFAYFSLNHCEYDIYWIISERIMYIYEVGPLYRDNYDSFCYFLPIGYYIWRNIINT